MSKIKVYWTNYSVAVNWLNNDYVRCNNIHEIDHTVWENMQSPLDVESGEPENGWEDNEIFQWYLTDANKSDVDWLRENFGLQFTYSELLDLFVLCVTHYGTSWDYVEWPTICKNAERKIGQKK